MKRWLKRLIFSLTVVLVLIASNILTMTSSVVDTALASVLRTFEVSTVSDQLKSQVRQSQSELKRIKYSNAALRVENQALRSKLHIQQTRIKTIGSNIRRRTLKSAAVNLGSIPAEAVPIIGWGVILSTTAYELKVACETVNDIDELYRDLGIKENSAPEEVLKFCNPQLPSKDELTTKIAAEFADRSSKVRAAVNWLVSVLQKEKRLEMDLTHRVP